MDARDFLALAQSLLTTEKTPRGFRTIIGRAYYASFNVAAEFLRRLGFDLPETGDAHVRTYRYLNNCKVREFEIVATKLNDLRTARNTSDYSLGDLSVEKEPVAILWAEAAKEIIQRIDSCSNDHSQRAQMKVEMLQYKRQMGW